MTALAAKPPALTAADRILETLAAAAAAGDPCPTNKDLGAVVGKEPNAVQFHLRALVARGAIAIETQRPHRRITVFPSGRATGWTNHRRNGRA